MNNAAVGNILMRRRKRRTNSGVVASFLDYAMLPCQQQQQQHHRYHQVRRMNDYFTAAITIRNLATTKKSEVIESNYVNRIISSTKKVAIIGGGLAGLSTAYHLLDINTATSNNKGAGGVHITIYDTANVGEGGASAVAGGLLHPFSPRGKLIHFGIYALTQANVLIQAASKYEPNCIIRKQLYRLASSFDDDYTNSYNILQVTANEYPNLATWLTREDVNTLLPTTTSVVGGIKMSNGCQVIHVPTYLKGLLRACEHKAETNYDNDSSSSSSSSSSITWKLVYDESTATAKTASNDNKLLSWHDMDYMNQHLSQYDIVILSAGAGLFINNRLLLDTGNSSDDDDEEEEDEIVRCLPVQLVRGQSIEMTLPTSTTTITGSSSTNNLLDEALLCGKYVSPLPPSSTDTTTTTITTTNNNTSRRYVIGATHEYQSIPLSTNEVQEELKSRTYQMAKQLWECGTIDRITCGVRVQSTRGKYGRMPIVGRINTTNASSTSSTTTSGISHHNTWIFTGLSSRGLIYHGLFGSWLANAILHNDESKIREKFPEFDWWRVKK